jgi:superfamily I DNA/RNA helicase
VGAADDEVSDDDGGGEEEERRVAFVGLTRARESVQISWHDTKKITWRNG